VAALAESVPKADLEAAEARIAEVEAKLRAALAEKRPKFCTICGKPLQAGNKFCNKCGTPVTKM